MRATAGGGYGDAFGGAVEGDRLFEEGALDRLAGDFVAEGGDVPLVAREALGGFEGVHWGLPGGAWIIMSVL